MAGGQYRMTARAIGMAPQQAMLYRRGEEDRLTWDAQLTTKAVFLADINVRGGPTRTILPESPTAGSTERSLSADAIARLPIDATDLNVLATLVPGVVGLDATDTTSAAFSVAGLGPEANAVTLDGLLFGSGSLPQDGIRSTRVITNTYDVSRGQFSGGLVSSTTRSGSNVIQGSSNYALRDNSLAITDDPGAFSQGFTQNTLSGGIGGPLVRDRLFAFISGQARLRNDQQLTLLSARDADLTRLGVAPDSVDRFMSLVQGAGLPTNSFAGDGSRSNNNYSGLARFDYVISSAHTLTLRGDWQGTGQDPARLGVTTLPQTGGKTSGSSGGGMLSVTSRFGVQVINEVRAYISGSRRDGNPFSTVPEGRVQVASTLPDGTSGISALTFGGNTGMPTRSRATTFEATDEASWLPGDGSHRLRIGGLFNTASSRDVLSRNQLGSFSFNSLADFENDLPSAFRRTLAPTDRHSSSLNWALYAGDTWLVSRAFQVTYGLRYEGTSFRDQPAFNPVVDSLFGVRTDKLPSENHLSPRVGFNLMVGGGPGAPPALTVRGGVGEFRSQIPGSLAAAAAAATGLASSESQIVCIGADTPVPDWISYRQDPATIPTACLNGGGPVSAPSRNVTVFDQGFAAPRAWRTSLGFQRTLTGLIRLSVDGSAAWGLSQTGYTDLNLAANPAFTLANEGNRPVYVPAGQIIPQTGAVGLSGSRRDSTFGQVLETTSGLKTQSRQLTIGLGGITRKGIIVNASYTYSRSRDQTSSFGFGGGNTAGDPNQVEWATSSFQRLHSLLLTTMLPIGRSIELTAITRLNAGAPYTPLVGSDINGDGFRNDRAFVFGTNAADPVVAAAMSDLLASASSRVRGCLEKQTGRIAGRNSCTGPWQASLDLQLNWRPRHARTGAQAVHLGGDREPAGWRRSAPPRCGQPARLGPDGAARSDPAVCLRL